MSAELVLRAIRRDRAGLAGRWLDRFAANRAARGRDGVAVGYGDVAALFDDLLAMLDSAEARPRGGVVLADRLVPTDAVAVVIDLLQAGVQVLGAFAVENAGPFAAWSIRQRNLFLGELDAIFPVLVRREVAALCAGYTAPAAAATAAVGVGKENTVHCSRPDLPQARLIRN